MDDSLSSLLANIRITRFTCRRIQLDAPWGIKIASSEAARFCTVFGGQVHVDIPSADRSYLLEPGDTIMFPHGAAHMLRDRPDSPVTLTAGDEPEEGGFTSSPTIERHGDGRAGDIVIGGYHLDRICARPLLRVLPSVMLMKAEGCLPEWREALIAMRRKELQRFSPGSAGVLRHIASVRFAQMVRHFVATHMKGDEFFSGDLAVATAIFAMHENPREAWTVARLARLAGMSRSGFSAAFSASLGESPMRYLVRIRMANAAELLHLQDIPLSDAATEAGYSTSEAFVRAFKRHFGTTPGEYRKQKGSARAASASFGGSLTSPA